MIIKEIFPSFSPSLFLVSECYRRERVGFKHFFTSMRETVTVADVSACNAACQKASYCLSFSYRSACDRLIIA